MVGNGWLARIEAASAQVAQCLAGPPDDAWLDVVEGTWTAKDVVGHLAAWSDLLLDEVEVLVRDGAGIVVAFDVDAWNASQVAARRDWPVARVRAAWKMAAERARHVVARLTARDLARRCPVRWTADPVTPEHLLGLWVDHVGDHRASLAAWSEKHKRNSST